MHSPMLYIIAGCNGAGKTTASISVLPNILKCRQFVNADAIAKGLSPLDPDSVALLAGKMMLERIHELLSRHETFAIETTLSTRSYVNLVRKAHKSGYKVVLLFFYLQSVKLAEERVAQRVSEGGHNIPAPIIERRYFAGIKNLFELFIPIVDSWIIADNSNTFPQIIATQDQVFNQEFLQNLKDYVRKGKK